MIIKGHEFQKHHLFHESAIWQSHDVYKRLRGIGGMVTLLDKDSHRELHKSTPSVGLPPLMVARKTVEYYGKRSDPVTNIDNMCFALEFAAEEVAEHDLEYDRTLNTIEALRLQIPFVIQGTPNR